MLGDAWVPGDCWDQSSMSGQLEGAFWPSWPRLLLTNAQYSHPDSCFFFFLKALVPTAPWLLGSFRRQQHEWTSSKQIQKINHTHSQSQLDSLFFSSSRTCVFVVAYYTAQINIVIFSASKIAAGSYNGIKYVSISWCSAKSPITSRCSATGTSLRTTDL